MLAASPSHRQGMRFLEVVVLPHLFLYGQDYWQNEFYVLNMAVPTTKWK